MNYKIILLLSIGFILGCNSSKQTSESNENIDKEESASLCQEEVTAKDFSDLDGCTMMLINEKGEKLLLAQNNQDIPIENGKSYKVGYKILQGMASICMAENAIIELTCIELIGAKSSTLNCKPSQNGFDDAFLKSLIDQNEIGRIERFDFADLWAYKVESLNKKWLYNCEGKELCGGDFRNFSECFATFRSELKNPKIIFQAEGPKE